MIMYQAFKLQRLLAYAALRHTDIWLVSRVGSPKAFFPLYFAVYVIQGIWKYYISTLQTGEAWLPKKS